MNSQKRVSTSAPVSPPPAKISHQDLISSAAKLGNFFLKFVSSSQEVSKILFYSYGDFSKSIGKREIVLLCVLTLSP